MLALGILIGIALSILIFTIMCFFRAGIEKRIKIIETQLGRAGPKPKGYIFELDDDVTLAREDLIKKNKEAGRDTPLEDLRNL